MDKHNCDNVNCNHYNYNGLCCLFNPDNCKYRQLQKENARLTTNEKSLIAERKIIVKENAELKETVIKMNNVITETFSNLTKAKEIIKEILEEDNYSLGLPKELRLKTEQFIKDSEVEK